MLLEAIIMILYSHIDFISKIFFYGFSQALYKQDSIRIIQNNNNGNINIVMNSHVDKKLNAEDDRLTSINSIKIVKKGFS